MKSYAFKLLMETTLFYNIRYLNIRLITNQDERIYDYSNWKYVHMFYNKENFFLNALMMYADIFCISVATAINTYE